MKSLIYAVAAASVLAAPLVSFAQSDSSLTRAQVRTELKQLESAGYVPGGGDEPNYPANIQAAEARIAPSDAGTGYGGAVSGSSASGGGTAVRPASPAEMNKLYFGGQ
ncbi:MULTISPECIES: DUF4148 domain-containing protein [unclassified Caballeronia]|uniref:DUF4148 domain-containing protein n=1 Tax=unclassified Caballeronia TaxID=2646786 RepID=UPI0028659B6A|nr:MULTISPECIES: DUF4148 domain-containing protein [unclassified Caballeronia]MDR5753929.1 DUF4148 domain-containing protein [Caballeronia sp. LZ024]MDR5840308.1 DUF4148 domain-containing protein [Caballeronia sp. LZ031]